MRSCCSYSYLHRFRCFCSQPRTEKGTRYYPCLASLFWTPSSPFQIPPISDPCGGMKSCSESGRGEGASNNVYYSFIKLRVGDCSKHVLCDSPTDSRNACEKRHKIFFPTLDDNNWVTYDTEKGEIFSPPTMKIHAFSVWSVK